MNVSRCRRWVMSVSALSAMLLGPSILCASPAPSSPGLEILVASPTTGIAGAIRQGAARVDFESRLDDSRIRSEIRGADGHRIWLYVEELDSHQPPHIEINGRAFDGEYSPALIDVLKSIAGTSEGKLIRALALDLCFRIPGKELVAYRRGLETAYQAMQIGYAEDPRQPPRRSESRVQSSTLESASRPPADVRIKSAIGTEDYLFSEAGGYVVKTQHHEVVFTANYLSNDHERVKSTLGVLPIQPLDDPNIGNGCFGMCGKGCTNDFSCRGFKGWSHEWVGATTYSVSAYCSCNVPEQIIDPDCTNFQPGAWKTTNYATTGTLKHTIQGWSSPGCISHDTCCRALPGWACFLCTSPWGIQAQLECAAGIGWPVSWSYEATQSDVYSTYEFNSSCRTDCPDCGSGIFPDPIQVDP